MTDFTACLDCNQMTFRSHILHSICAFLAALGAIASWDVCSAEDESKPTPQQLEFFESKVRPVFANRCYKCHGQNKQEGKLRLDSRKSILTGGESGEAINLKNLADSLVIEAINFESLEMPPDDKLPASEIADAQRLNPVRSGVLTSRKFSKYASPESTAVDSAPPLKPILN